MVDETVDLILVKEGRVEITCLLHFNCLISQCCFYKKKSQDSLHIKNTLHVFSSCVSFSFTETFGFDLKRVESVYTFSVILTIHIYFGRRKWAASSEFFTYHLCEQRRFRRACASAQSRQNIRCSLIQAVSQEEPPDRKPDPWPL